MKVTMWIPDTLAKELGRELLFSDDTDDRVYDVRTDEVICDCDSMSECDGHTIAAEDIKIGLEEPSKMLIALGEALTSGPGAISPHPTMRIEVEAG